MLHEHHSGVVMVVIYLTIEVNTKRQDATHSIHWVPDEPRGKEYSFPAKSKSHNVTQSVEICTKVGSSFPEPRSHSENEYIANLVETHLPTISTIWLGIHYKPFVNPGWYWDSDNSPMHYTAWPPDEEPPSQFCQAYLNVTHRTWSHQASSGEGRGVVCMRELVSLKCRYYSALGETSKKYPFYIAVFFQVVIISAIISQYINNAIVKRDNLSDVATTTDFASTMDAATVTHKGSLPFWLRAYRRLLKTHRDEVPEVSKSVDESLLDSRYSDATSVVTAIPGGSKHEDEKIDRGEGWDITAEPHKVEKEKLEKILKLVADTNK